MTRAAIPALLLVQLAGLILSAALLAVTFVQREQLEGLLQGFAVEKVQAATADILERLCEDPAEGGLKAGAVAGMKKLAGRFDMDAERLDAFRKETLPALVRSILAEHCELHCNAPLLRVAFADSAMAQRVADLNGGSGTLRDFAIERYDSTIAGLVSDLRRFGVVNIVAFSLMIALLALRRWLNWRFVALSVAMTGYVAWAAYGYVFSQNWAYSILFQDWAAGTYQVTMMIVCLFLIDQLFLRGFFLNLIGNLLASLLPS